MKELTPKRSYSFSLCLYLSKSYNKDEYFIYNYRFFFLRSDTVCQSSFIFSANSVLLSSNKYISYSSSCLSLKFSSSSALRTLILFYFRFMIYSSCQIIIYVPYESLESFYCYLLFYSSSRISYLSKDRTFCSNSLNLLIYISIWVSFDLLAPMPAAIYLISFNFDKDRGHFSPIFAEFLPLRMVFSYDDEQASFSSRKTISSQISSLSKEECLVVYISLLPIICVALWEEICRQDQSCGALQVLIR